ncbi:MAG TPA: hypothetical protein VMZ32_14940 [Gammaproteobacteria bacterium]|nr:hypothetical protein [Gammaproteobacteria bacterium]
MNLSLFATLLSLATFVLIILMMLQMRSQRLATAALIEDNRIRTGLFQDADESTSFILARTIQNIAAGEPDPSLESDTFALRVVRELVKRKLPKIKWLEIQSNERLVHEIYLLLREGEDKKGPPPVRTRS